MLISPCLIQNYIRLHFVDHVLDEIKIVACNLSYMGNALGSASFSMDDLLCSIAIVR